MTGRYKGSRPKKMEMLKINCIHKNPLNVYFLIVGIDNLCLENEQKLFKKSAK